MGKRLAAVTAWCFLFLFPILEAQANKVWEVSGAEQFSKGKLDGLSLLSTGELELAPALEKIEGLDANYLWDIAVSKDGTVYVGTGSPAALYAVKEGQVKVLDKTGEKHILSVLPLEDGSVLAATAPRGIIHRVDSDGRITIFADLEEDYVWDMVLSAEGKVLCATGPRGRLIELSEGGEAKELFKADVNHLMCVARDESGNVFVGTEPKGLVYQIDVEGRSTVLYDADETEVHSLLAGPDGWLYVGTAQSESQGGAPSGGPPSGPPSGGNNAAAMLAGKPSAYNSVYRIKPGQGAERLAHLSGVFVLSLARTELGEVLAGTGVEGRLLAVEADGTSRIVTQFEASQISAMATDSEGGLYVATSNSGGLWKLSGARRPSGTFTTEVFDAGYMSRWGRLWWRGELGGQAQVKVSLRTGNIQEPDGSWGEWCEPVIRPSGGQVGVSPARFAQARAVLESGESGAGPSLVELKASYRQVNRRPQIRALEVKGPKKGPKQPPGRPEGANQPTHKKTITWQAADPNDDDLAFDLYYRAVDEEQWKELEKDVTGQPKYEWNTDRVPDGHYLVRLVASDRPANREPLRSIMISRPVLIDNTRPLVTDLKWERDSDGSYTISGLATDSYSNIVGIEVSLNSNDWEPVFPTDDILDSTQEQFSYRTEVLGEGEHVFVFAARDEDDNVGSEKVLIKVP